MIQNFKLWLAKKSLAFKLIASNVICVSIGFAILEVFIFGRSQHMLKSQIEESAQRTTQSYVADMTHLIVDTEQIVLNAKNALEQFSEKSEDSIKVILNAALNTTSNSGLNFTDAWIYVFEEDNVKEGTLFLSEASDSKATDFEKEKITNLYDRFPWFKEVPKEEKIFWSEPYVDEYSKKTVTTCLLPFMFKDSKIFNGLVALSVDLTDIKKDMESFSSHENGTLLLLSKEGLYVTHPNKNIVLKKTIFELAKDMNLPVLARVGEELRRGNSGTVEIGRSSVVRGEAIFFYAPIKKNNWSICLVYAKAKLFRSLHEFLMAAGLAIFVGMAVLLGFINFICSRLTRQLQHLSKLAAKYSAGDFSSDFKPIPSSKEITALSKAMSDMRINILDYIEKEKAMASERQKIQSEMDIARSIQKATISATNPHHKAFKINTTMLPAKKVSGDFYDFFFIGEDKFAFVVADVSGKDVPAALYMMKSQALIKNIARHTGSISEVFERVNEELYEGNDSCMFVSAFMGMINIKTGEFEYVNAGHPHPFLDLGKGYKLLDVKNNIVLGVKKNAQFASQKVNLKKGNRIFVYTDGVTEAENKKFAFYGEDRLGKILAKKAEDTLKTVMVDLKLFTAGHSQSDDITMLEFVYLGQEESKMSIKAEITKLDEVLSFVQTDMERLGIESQKRFKMVMAAEEVFSNIALYASAVSEVDIKSNIKDGAYFITFSDDGKKYNPLTREDPNISVPIEEREVGGLGIFIVKKVADILEYNYQNKKNVLTIGIKI